MGIKQLNRDFTTTCGVVRYGNGEDASVIHSHSIASSMDWVVRHIDAPTDLYGYERNKTAGVVRAFVSERRIFAAARHGVLVRSDSPNADILRSGAGYRIPIMMYTKWDDGINWRWHCPLFLKLSDDLHWKGLIERDKWQRFIKRLNSVCAEASIFAHAFRHGA